MLKSIKKIVSLAASAVLITVMAAPAYAVNKNDMVIEAEMDMDFDTYLNSYLPKRIADYKNGSVTLEEIVREYTDRTLPVYFMTNELYGEYDISDAMPLHNFDGEDADKFIVIVSENGKMVASLTVELIDGRMISAFVTENFEEIDEALSSDEPVAFGYSNGCFMMYSDDKFQVVDNPDFVDEKFVGTIEVDASELVQADSLAVRSCSAEAAVLDSLSFNTYGTDSVSSVAAAQSYPATYTVSPTVKNVYGEVNPDAPASSGAGLCGYACAASMGMQYYKNKRTYTAKSLYNAAKYSLDPTKPSGSYPIGSNDWLLFVFNTILGMPVSAKGNALTANQVKNCLQLNKPMLCELFMSNKKGHGMVLFYYVQTSGETGQYIFMDPGNSSNYGRLSVLIDKNVMNNGRNLHVTSRQGDSFVRWGDTLY